VRVSADVDGATLVLSFAMAGGEPRPSGKVTMVRDQVRFGLPEGWSLDDLHPDLLALAGLLVCQPFSGGTLELPRAVSPAFATAARRGMSLELTPVDPVLEPRRGTGVPALCFSGGVDSLAALAVLPGRTELFFLDRVQPADVDHADVYESTAAHRACDAVERDHGRTVWRVASDLEYVRKPIGFPLHVSNALPAVLMADELGLDAVGWGTVSESAYGIGKAGYIEYATRRDYRRLGAVFAAAGLPYLQSVVGVSEVGTTRIVAQSRFAGLAQSCIRGQPEPCLSCKKCFRKVLLDRVIAGQPVEDAVVDGLLSSEAVRNYLSEEPIHHENVIAYILARYEGSHPAMRALDARVGRRGSHLSWMDGWYAPSAELMPERYRSEVRAGLERHLPTMDQADEEAMRGWDPQGDTGGLGRILAQRRLSRALGRCSRS
jgi:hypothetical protein